MAGTSSLNTAALHQFRAPVPGSPISNAQCRSLPSGVVQLSLPRTSVGAARQGWRSALSWTSSSAFGQANSPHFAVSASTTTGGPSEPFFIVKSFTQEQSKLVKESWKIVQKNNPGKYALEFFLKVFEIAPSAKRLFSFLKDSPYPIEKDPKLKSHALQVYVLTGESAALLGEKGALDALHPKLLELGRTHAVYGVKDEHFDVVKFALLCTLERAVADTWSAEMREAWAQAYDELVECIKEEMTAVRSSAGSSS